MNRAVDNIIIHYVGNYEGTSLINAHTHGVLEHYNHLDLQIVLPIDHKFAANILNNIVDLYIAKGNSLIDGEMNPYLLQEPAVKTVKMKEDGRDVFRIVFPDKNGFYPEDEGCKDIFSEQYSDFTD